LERAFGEIDRNEERARSSSSYRNVVFARSDAPHAFRTASSRDSYRQLGDFPSHPPDVWLQSYDNNYPAGSSGSYGGHSGRYSQGYWGPSYTTNPAQYVFDYQRHSQGAAAESSRGFPPVYASRYISPSPIIIADPDYLSSDDSDYIEGADELEYDSDSESEYHSNHNSDDDVESSIYDDNDSLLEDTSDDEESYLYDGSGEDETYSDGDGGYSDFDDDYSD